MKLFRNLVFMAFLPVMMVGNAYASAYQEDNIKMHCAILKNGKVIKQQSCVADGYVYSSAASGSGSGYTFKSIRGYGVISVNASSEVVTDAKGEPIYNSDGTNKLVSSETMNDKSAIMRYRMPKTFKLLTKSEEERYLNGGLKVEPYTCFIHKTQPKYEFCFSQPLM